MSDTLLIEVEHAVNSYYVREEAKRIMVEVRRRLSVPASPVGTRERVDALVSEAWKNSRISNERDWSAWLRVQINRLTSPSAGGVTGAGPTQAMVEAGARADYEHVFEGVDISFDDLAPALRRVHIDSARRVLTAAMRAAAAEQPRTVERWQLRTQIAGLVGRYALAFAKWDRKSVPPDIGPDHMAVADEILDLLAAAPEGSPAPEPQCDFWYPNHGVERRCELARGHSGDHVLPGSAGPFRRPNVTEPRTPSERETLADRLEHVAGARIDWQRPETIASLLREAAAALRTPAPSGEAEPRAWLREYRNRDGEWIPNHLRLDRPPPSDHPQIRDTPLYAQGERTTTRNEGEG